MVIRELYETLLKYQERYEWLDTVNKIDKIDISKREWRFELLIFLLRISRWVWLDKFLKDSKNIIEEQTIRNFIGKIKTYAWNRNILTGTIKKLVEWLSFEFKDLELNLSKIDQVINNKITADDFLNNLEKATIEDLEDDDSLEPAYLMFDFKWASWKSYEWVWFKWLHKLNEADLMDIYKWYNWDNERFKIVRDYIVNNESTIKTEIKWVIQNLRLALISWMLILFKKENCKIEQYILAKSEPETNETTVSEIVPF